MAKGKNAAMSLGFKISFMVLATMVLISLAGSTYDAYIYKKIVMKEFQERIITLGENTASLVSQSMLELQNLQNMSASQKAKLKINPERRIKQRINEVLQAAVSRKDIIYAAIKQNNAVISSAFVSGNAKLPEKTKTDKKFTSYPLYSVLGKGESSYEITIPIELKGGDELLLMGNEVGQLILGFDMKSITKQINSGTQSAFIFTSLNATVIGVLIVLFIFFNMIRPIKKLSRISARIATGDISENIEVIKSNDEIGVLTKSFHEMSEYINFIAWVSENVSSGEVVDAFEPKSDKDTLGISFIKMLKYINEISSFLGKVAKGDLTTSFMAKSDKDMLGNACADMTASLKTLVSSIQDQSNFLADSSKQMMNISEQSKATIGQLAETISNISNATSEAAKNSQTASHASIKAENSAKKGTERMNMLLEKMTELSSEIGLSTQSMNKLGKHSEEIKNMTAVIKSVADETRLLSFNAAIEAARAGEAGRGFVVVAEEIRKLSDMSNEQAVKIAERIKAVLKDIAEAIEIVNREYEGIRAGEELAKETNMLFIDIVKSVDETAAQMESIAASSQQIAASSQEASASSQEQSSSMEELNAVVSEFADTANTLKSATDKFIL